MRLEDLKRGAQVRGLDPHQLVTVVDVQWHGANAVELFYKRADGQPGTQSLYRDDAAMLEVVQAGRAWFFDRFLLRAILRCCQQPIPRSSFER